MENASAAIKEWVELYTSEMVSWAYYKTSQQETAEDLVQETFIAAFQSFHKFQHKSKPKTWLFSILKNKIIDHHRKCYRDAVLPANKVSEEYSANLFGFFFEADEQWRKDQKNINWGTDTEELLDNPEFNVVLADCLNRLPASWNAALQLKYLEEKEQKTICQELEISTTNYWQIIHRAKLQLKACLENYWFKNE
jgi:RNA polymerase sigma-70 factor (TIGR02943 family)